MQDTVASVVPIVRLSSNSVFKQYRKHSVSGTDLSAEAAPLCLNTKTLNGEQSDAQIISLEGEKNFKEHVNEDMVEECEFSPREASVSTPSPLKSNHCSKSNRNLKYIVASQEASTDWDKVNLETEQEMLHNGCDSAAHSADAENNIRNSSISFLEAVRQLKDESAAWEPYIIPHHLTDGKNENCLISLLTWCVRRVRGCAPLLQRSREDIHDISVLQRDADFLSAMSAVPFDHSHVIHRRFLVTIHNALLDSCDNHSGSSRTGPMDWEKLGFQGCDPATDLRSSGVLGLMQLNYLVQYCGEFTKGLWAICTTNGEVQGEYDVYQDLPFVLIGFNFSSFVLEALKDPIFAEEIGKRARCGQRVGARDSGELLAREFPILTICCDYYVGCLFVFYEWWLQLKKQRAEKPPTIGDFGVVKAKVCARIKKNGIQFVLDASTRAHNLSHVDLQFSETRADPVESGSSGTAVEFTSI